MSKPLAVDLFAGLGGWSTGLILEGYDCVGFDIVRHVYGDHRYPAQLVLQDVLTLHGSQFRDAALIVASPPCQQYSHMAMPFKAGRLKAAAIRADTTGESLARLNRLFDACFRIQREACEAAGRHIPMVIENVKGAQPWVGRARWNFGSFYLWGDVPALMPPIIARKSKGRNWSTQRGGDFTRLAGERAIKNAGGSSFRIAHNTTSGHGQNPDGRPIAEGEKGVGPKWDPETKSGAHGMPRWTNPADGRKAEGSGAAWFDENLDARHREATATKVGGGHDGWFGANKDNPMRRHSSGSSSRKFASAMIAKIPLVLARHIGRSCYPREAAE